MVMTDAHKRYREKTKTEHKLYMNEYRKKNYEIRKQKYIESGQKESQRIKYILESEMKRFRNILI